MSFFDADASTGGGTRSDPSIVVEYVRTDRVSVGDTEPEIWPPSDRTLKSDRGPVQEQAGPSMGSH